MRRFRFSTYVFVVAGLAWAYMVWATWTSGQESIAFHGYGAVGLTFALMMLIAGGLTAFTVFLIFRWMTRGRN